MILVVILGVVIAIASILFAFQNATVVTISLGALTLQESLAIILLATLGLGIVISLLLSLPTIIKRGWINSRQKKKIEELEQKLAKLQRKVEEKGRYSQALRENQQQFYKIFDLADRVTGLLDQESAIVVTNYVLEQLKTKTSKVNSASLTVFIIAVEPAKTNSEIPFAEWENSITRAISKRLLSVTEVNSYWGVTPRKRFICLVQDLTGEEIYTYSDRLIAQFQDKPLQKADGTTLSLRANLGGAIVDPTDEIDSRSLLKTAESNLEQAREQKRNSMVITEIVGTTSIVPKDT